MKSRDGKSQRREEKKKEKLSEERRLRQKVGNSRNTVFFKSRLAKAAGAEPSGQMRDEKLHAVVAQSTFSSQNAQNTPGPDHV